MKQHIAICLTTAQARLVKVALESYHHANKNGLTRMQTQTHKATIDEISYAIQNNEKRK